MSGPLTLAAMAVGLIGNGAKDGQKGNGTGAETGLRQMENGKWKLKCRLPVPGGQRPAPRRRVKVDASGGLFGVNELGD